MRPPFAKLRHKSFQLAMGKLFLLLLLCVLVLLPVVWYYAFPLGSTVAIFGEQPTLSALPDTPSEPFTSVSLDDPDPKSFDRPVLLDMKNCTQLSFNVAYEAEWRQHPHLVVYGVLATDKPERRVIRDAQRSTWLRYPDVATRWNAFNGLMLVLYPAAPFARKCSNITVDMMEEMDEHHDVLMLRMKEGRFRKAKVRDQPGYIGLPFHVSNTRKLLFYLLYAHYAFPTTPFIAKGDDDSYVYVPEYMRMVRQLPRINVVYGAVHTPFDNNRIRMALGYSYLLTRDVVRTVMSNGMIAYFLRLPFMANHSDVYVDIGFHHEDWTVVTTLHRLYGFHPHAPRPLPSLPLADDRLPPVEGWGMYYMEYVQDPRNVLHTGRAVGTEGQDMSYTFPLPSELKPGNVLLIDGSYGNNTARRLVVSHGPTAALMHFRAYYKSLAEYQQIDQPNLVFIADKGFYSDAQLLYENSQMSKEK